MTTEFFINPAFSSLTDFIKEIPGNFSRIGQEIHTGRNEVREVKVGDTTLVIKYFKRITWVNRFFFAWLRKSKARRSYEYSTELIRRGFSTPAPIAYINCYRHGLLYQCYYICAYTDFRPIAGILTLSLSESEEALRAFARFTFRLHRSGIFHGDFGKWNILYSCRNGQYDFSLIDNNRILFRRYRYKRGVRNLERIGLPLEKLGVIAAEYARQAHASDIRTLNAMFLFRLGYKSRKTFRRWAKNIFFSKPRTEKQASCEIQTGEVMQSHI